MNSKVGMFSVLILGVMMLFIPTSSLANAQENDSYYEQDKYYNDIYIEDSYKQSDYSEPYKKDNDKQYKNDDESSKPVIIIKNEPIVKKEKKKEKKESPMLLVKKDVLYCDFFSGTNQICPLESILGPDSDRYIQECTVNEFVCDNINEEFFDMIVTDNIEFLGSQDGKKIKFNGERFTVSEDISFGEIQRNESFNSECKEAGFDGSFVFQRGVAITFICTLNEGDCSGIIHDGELKECTVKNYVVAVIFLQ